VVMIRLMGSLEKRYDLGAVVAHVVGKVDDDRRSEIISQLVDFPSFVLEAERGRRVPDHRFSGVQATAKQ